MGGKVTGALAGAGAFAAGALALHLTGTPVARADYAGDDYGRIRATVIGANPIGTPIEEVARRVIAAGFDCDVVGARVANVTRVAVSCGNVEGRADASRLLRVDLVTRNAELADVAVSDVYAQFEASASNVDPTPRGVMAAIDERAARWARPAAGTRTGGAPRRAAD